MASVTHCRFGRKVALTWSIYVMSIPTSLVGCLPTYAQVRCQGRERFNLCCLLYVLSAFPKDVRPKQPPSLWAEAS